MLIRLKPDRHAIYIQSCRHRGEAVNKAEKYWYSFNLDGWFDAAGRKLHISSMEPIVRGCDYDAIAARLSDAENERDVSRQRACGWRDKAEADLLLARQENERLRAALTTYGAHRPSCPRSARPPGAATCICGLHDLLASKAETEVKL